MSFGFGIGDFIAVGELCWKLYSQVYKVSRDAPEELRGLNQELGNLHNTIQLLVEELKDEDSVLKRSGDVRINLVNRVMSQSEETLKKMQQLSKRYAELQTPAKGQGKRLNPRIYWDRLKYSQELHTINDLRAKIMLHNSQLALVLQGAQHSSLERIEKQFTQTDKRLDELRQLLRQLLMTDDASRDRPRLTAPLDQNALMELTNIFLQKAEFDNRPWASIGIDNWLQAGQWWLMKAQSQLGSSPQAHEEHSIYRQGYTNMLKACWILIDIIAIHPQRTHMGASNDHRAHNIQRLTQGAISKLQTLSNTTFQLKDFLTCNLDIWNIPPSTALTPRQRNTSDQPELKWQTQSGELLYQKFAEYQDDERAQPVECIVILVMQSGQCMKTPSLNLIVQNSFGQDIYKRYECQSTSYRSIHTMNYGHSVEHDRIDRLQLEIYAEDFPIKFFAEEDKRLLKRILESLSMFRDSPQSLPLDASMIYSAALLRPCLSVQGKSLPFQSRTAIRGINTLTRSRDELQITPTTHISASFQQIVDRITEYIIRCSECFPRDSDQIFWMEEHQCMWMLIYWLCDTTEAFSELFKAIGSCSPIFHPLSEGCLIKCSLLRKDTEFFQKFVSYTGLNPNWILKDRDILFIAIHNEDTAAINTAIKEAEGKYNISWTVAWKFAYTHLNWNAMDVLLSAPNLDQQSLYTQLFWLVENHKWDQLQVFSDFIQLHVKDFDNIIKKNLGNAENPNQNFYRRPNGEIMKSCAELIYKGSLHHLELFLDIALRLGINFDGLRLATTDRQIQWAILPALVSRKLSVLKLLFEVGVVSPSIEVIDNHFYELLEREQSRSRDSQLTGFSLKGPQFPLEPAIENFQDSPGDSQATRSSFTRPRFPLDLAIAFALDLEIVEYLCSTGARLEKDFNDSDINEPETLRKLRLTTSIEDARKRNCYAKCMLYQFCSMERRISQIHGKFRSLPANTMITTGRIMFESDCRHLYDTTNMASQLTWPTIQNDLYPGELKDAPIKGVTSWPTPLSTQESWNDWRSKVINILEKTNKEH